MSNQKPLYIYDKREPVLLSWLRDTYSFGALCFTIWLTNTQMEPSGFINFMVGSLWLLWMIGKGAQRRIAMTADEARAWLDENYPHKEPTA